MKKDTMTIAQLIKTMLRPVTKTLHRAGVRILFFALAAAPIMSVQALDNWPTPSVALYDCNVSKAGTDNGSQVNALNSASKCILQNILKDTSTKDVFLFSYGFADTTAGDMASSGTVFTLPDSGGSRDAVYDFIIASAISGNSGGYTLTVTLYNGHTLTRVVEGSAGFSSATTAAVSAACVTALQKILPLTAGIRAYLISVKAAYPALTINPQIVVSPTRISVPLKGSTSVVITVTDCDGMPVANRHVALESTRGSFAASFGTTDGSGKATVTFNAGNAPGAAALTATMNKTVSILGDTTSPLGTASIVLGDADTKNMWVLEFDVRRSFTSYQDEITSTPDEKRWKQKNSFWSQHATGRYMAESTNDTNTEFEFSDSLLTVYGKYFSHDFKKETFTDLSGNSCPKSTWSMGGSTETWSAQVSSERQGGAHIVYDPQGITLFDIAVPYSNPYAYEYDWHIDGIFENGQCRTQSIHDCTRFKMSLNMTGGVTLSGIEPVQGLSMSPTYTGKTITGYMIFVDQPGGGMTSNGTVYVTSNQCSATLRPVQAPTPVEKTEPANIFSLAQNYPNPFNPATRISFTVGSRSTVSMKVFDPLGREVATLVSEEMPAGEYSRIWKADAMPSGVYFYRMQAGAFSETKRLILLK